MPAFDNALLGHKDPTRIIDEGDRNRVARDVSAGAIEGERFCGFAGISTVEFQEVT